MKKLHLVDIGARGGIHPRWTPFHSKLKVTAFEPDPKECAALNAKQHPYEITYLPVALGARNNEHATLHITSAPGCSSTLEPNMALATQFAFAQRMAVQKSLPVSLQRLDSVLTEAPDVMKVDTQGTELHVLEGAGTLLDNTLAVELEVEFVEQYVGQPLFADVDQFMRSKGFTLRALRRSYWRHKDATRHPFGGQLIHGDALYFRLDRMNSTYGLPILAAYKQYDLLDAYGANNLMPSTSIPRWLAQRAAKKLGSNRRLRSFVDGLRLPNASDWHDPEFF